MLQQQRRCTVLSWMGQCCLPCWPLTSMRKKRKKYLGYSLGCWKIALIIGPWPCWQVLILKHRTLCPFLTPQHPWLCCRFKTLVIVKPWSSPKGQKHFRGWLPSSKCHRESQSFLSLWLCYILKVRFPGLQELPEVLENCWNFSRSLGGRLTSGQAALYWFLEEEVWFVDEVPLKPRQLFPNHTRA